MPPTLDAPVRPRLSSGELFAGIGSLALAVEEALGAETVWVAEDAHGPAAALSAWFPAAPNHGDVTTLDWGRVEPVHVLSGGSPCQSVSTAGRRAGMVPGATSNLWAAQRAGVAALSPAFVVWENVLGAATAKAHSRADPRGRRGLLRALGRVAGDLAGLGYDSEWRLQRASDVGACHERARIFLLAWDPEQVPGVPVEAEAVAVWDDRNDYFHRPGSPVPWAEKLPVDGAVRAGSLFRRRAGGPWLPDVPYLRTPTASGATGGHLTRVRAGELGAEYRLSSQILELPRRGPDVEWGVYATAVARHEGLLGGPAPDPVEVGRDGAPRLAAAFVEWMMNLPAGWVTDPALGITRTAALTALGNAVVPTQATAALTQLLNCTYWTRPA